MIDPVASLQERLELLTSIARGDEDAGEEKLDKEGSVVNIKPSVRDRLAAIKLLSELQGDIQRAKAPREDGDDVSKMSLRQLQLELEGAGG